jgi:hypothetical protein
MDDLGHEWTRMNTNPINAASFRGALAGGSADAAAPFRFHSLDAYEGFPLCDQRRGGFSLFAPWVQPAEMPRRQS